MVSDLVSVLSPSELLLGTALPPKGEIDRIPQDDHPVFSMRN